MIFGPVWPSATHPDTPAAGIEALALIARSVNVPVIAIGGVTEARVVECLGAGAAGHAAIGMFR